MDHKEELLEELKNILWKQFSASIEMLEKILQQTPDTLLGGNQRFYFTLFHTLVFLDYYLTFPPSSFSPTLAFTLVEPENIPAEALDDVIPNRVYTQKELLEYLDTTRLKGKMRISRLSEESIQERFVEDNEVGAMDYPLWEILLYNLRHTQHHIGQLNVMLKQGGYLPAPWIAQGNDVDLTGDS